MGTMWGPQGCRQTMWGQRGDYGDVQSTWTQWRHGDNIGQCGDNMGTTWGPQGCGYNVETWGQHGDHGDVETTWGQHGDNMRTMWGQHGVRSYN